MALTVTHNFVSAIPDDADATLVRPSNWNDVHAMSGVLPVANGGTGITSFGTGIDTFLGTPTSANLAAALTDETGTGAAVFANTPTFVTPILGTPTSGNLANCTGYPVGSISGTVPATAGGTGQTTYAKGDILASPGSNTLNKLPVGTDAFVLTADAASTNGIKWAAASAGGTPAGSGTEIQYRNAGAFGAMAGTAWDNTNRSLTMTGATVTTSNPVLNMTQTWNAGAVAFTGLKLNVTSTASAAASLLMDLQVATASQFNIDKAGQVSLLAGQAAFTSFSSSYGVTGLNIQRASAGPGIARMIAISFGPSGTVDTAETIAIAGQASGSNILGMATGGVFGFHPSVSTTAVALTTKANLDTKFTRGGVATLQFGDVDAATAVAQTTQVQSVVAGTSNTAGANWTLNGSKSTGNAAGGDIIFQVVGAAIAAATAQNTLSEVFRLTSGTNTKAILTSAGTSTFLATTTPGGSKATALSAGSGGSVFEFDSSGVFAIMAAVKASVGAGSGTILINLTGNGSDLSLINSTALGWSSTGDALSGTKDVFIKRAAAATIQQGAADAATAVAQTTQVQSVVAGTANGTAGADWTFKTSSGTGTGTGGNFILKTPFSAKSSGTGQGTWVDRDIYVSKGKVLTSATPVSLFEIALPAGAMAGGTVYATIICTNGTDMQSFSQAVSYSVVNKAGVYTKSITAATGDKSVTGASTLTTTWTLLDGTNKSTVQVSATTSLTPSTNAFICYYSMANNSEQATTIL